MMMFICGFHAIFISSNSSSSKNNFGINLLLSSTDVEGDVLSYSITEGTQITASLEGNDLTFTPNQDFNGSESFTVSVNESPSTKVRGSILTTTLDCENNTPNKRRNKTRFSFTSPFPPACSAPASGSAAAAAAVPGHESAEAAAGR